jgi:hypothetical protein
MLAVITHTQGTSRWMDGCLRSVRDHLPTGAQHHVIEQHGDFLRARWDAFHSAEFVALVDDDDEVCGDALRLCMAAIKETGAGVAFTDQVLINEDGRELRADHGPVRYSAVARSPQTIHHLAVVRRAAIAPAAWDVAAVVGTGIEWMVKASAALQHGAVHVPVQGYRWRKHEGQHSARDHTRFTRALPHLRQATRSWMTHDARISQFLPR